MIELFFQNVSTSSVPLDEKTCLAWLQSFLPSFQTSSELSVRIVTPAESQALNLQYRGKDKPTNVLSFPFERPEQLPEAVEIPIIGDIIICADVVTQEAHVQDKSLEAHWCHMIIHGCLHLLGYDHIDEQDAIEMEQLEVELLQQLGFDNPYLTK